MKRYAERNSEPDAELEEAISNFRSSVHAWSADAYSRPRYMPGAAHQSRVWRLAAGWALGCVLVAGALFQSYSASRRVSEPTVVSVGP